MARLVETIRMLRKKREIVNTPHAKIVLKRQIDAAGRQIDRLVYKLYGLSEEEIALVAQANAAKR